MRISSTSSSIDSPRARSRAYRPYLSMSGWSELRLVTSCVMLLMRSVRSLSESCPTDSVAMLAGRTVSSVVDS